MTATALVSEILIDGRLLALATVTGLAVTEIALTSAGFARRCVPHRSRVGGTKKRPPT